ncbi:MAG: YicC/YloC family endoribonuclease [Pseudomonadota bacterium]
MSKSMTGFGRADGGDGSASWSWEIRSVNGRGLDLRLRLPSGYERLEPLVRQRLSAQLTRGSVVAQLDVRRAAGTGALRVNEEALETVISAAEDIRDRVGGSPLQADQLLALRGVLESVDADEGLGQNESRADAVLTDLDLALAQMIAARQAEGTRLAAVILEHVDSIAACVADVAEHPARTPDATKARLEAQLHRLFEAPSSATIDRDRLHQEAAVIATRADIEEEIKRLQAHIESARDLLSANEPIGRRLEFLVQEFNREANTLCSKSNDIAITEIGLKLKSLIDQVREQVQNIE